MSLLRAAISSWECFDAAALVLEEIESESYAILKPMVNRRPYAEIVAAQPGIGAILRWAVPH